MKRLLFCYLFLNLFASGICAKTDSLLNELGKTIGEVPVYDNQKTALIERLKKSLTGNNENPQKSFSLNAALYEEYKLFNYDSAYLYADKLLQLAYQTNDPALVTGAKLKMSFILLSTGLFKESFDTLNSIKIEGKPDSLKADYYALVGRYYFDLATYDYDNRYSVSYDVKGVAYIDSALHYYNPASFEYNYYQGLMFYKQGKTDIAFSYFKNLLARKDLTYHQYALTASTLSGNYLQNGETDMAIQLLAEAAIADIKGSIKETMAIFSLAELLYKKGDVKYASMYIENAIANANAYGARQRKAQVSSILSVIEKERINAIEAQNKLLIQYGIVTTLLLIALVTLTVIIRRQIKKLKEAKQIITAAHHQQQEINKMLDEAVKKLEDSNHQLEYANRQLEKANLQLEDSNIKLEEASKIKEECISYFFNIDSEFFAKLERLKTMLEKKIAEKKPEDIRTIVNNINLREEKEILLQSFDKVFLRVYPNFIPAFNSFFRAEDKISLSENGMLNSDIRIFALIRMGITDTDKIARILGYSVNTIYTYKAKIKNKSILPKDEFEDRLMEIKSA